MKIYVVIPAYEPDNNLIELCSNLQMRGIENIVVVNDGTQDSEIFNKVSSDFPHTRILNHKKNMGKGMALKTAFQYLLENTDAEGCITADSDGQHKTDDIIKCMISLEKHPESLVLGCRQFDWGKTPFKSRIGNRFTLRYFYDVTKIRVSDTQTGLRGLSKKLMQECLNLSGERFDFEMNMLVSFAKKYCITEVPIACIYKAENKASHFKPFRDSLKIIRMMHKAARNN